ncbi:hypothetical protein KHQ89_00345 [Mycoplasmatota bacterium]|nr:hypothetical protein KHQ89_00345 [Mycoplasmatota bacterium]
MIGKDLDFEDEGIWNTYEPTPGDVSYDTTIMHGGIKSLEMISGCAWLGIGFDGLPYPKIGDEVKLGFWVYVDSTNDTSVAGNTFRLEEITSGTPTTVITYTTADLDFALDTWVYIETDSAVISASVDYIQIVIEEGTDGTIFVDDVSAIQVND